MVVGDPELEQRHLDAEATVKGFGYMKPEAVGTAKGFVRLGTSPLIKGMVQVIKKNGGENNLHYHKAVDTFWMVLKGRVRFYGPEDVVIGEFGPFEGTITPRFSRYWFENVGDEDLELLQVAANAVPNQSNGGRTDVTAQKFVVGTAEMIDAAER
jgi:mannose-6-phosphate isomerase-like protein (cupin superfamily)